MILEQPIMIFSGGMGESKVLGNPADLKQLDNDDNLVHSLDFRQVYASVLQDWMSVNHLISKKA